MTPQQLRQRQSIRSFSEKPIPEDLVKKLMAEITDINTHRAGLHFSLVTDDSRPFEGFSASYGMLRGVRNFVACIVDSTVRNVWIEAGYAAQQFVMFAVELGLGTCYVGGTFKRDAVNLQMRAGWKLPFVVAFGYPEEKEGMISKFAVKFLHRKKTSYIDFLADRSESALHFVNQNEWMKSGLEGLDSAPSSINRRPVRIAIENNTVKAYVEKPSADMLIDLGIGLWNFESASGGFFEIGNPAVFVPPEP